MSEMNGILVYIGVATLCSTVIAYDEAQVQSLNHDLLEVRSTVQHSLDVIKNRRNEISKKFTGEKLAIELQKNERLWDDFHEIELIIDDQKNVLEGPIEMLTKDAFIELYIYKLFTVLLRFEHPNSRFQKEPELVVPILLALSKYVESFTSFLKSNAMGTVGANPCRLADIIEAYFKPTLFNRLGKIEILITDYGKFSWYSKINEIFRAPFNPDGYIKNNKNYSSCVTSKQLAHILSSCYPDAGGFGTKVFYDYKNLACSQYFKHLSRIKDKLGSENDFYFGGSNGACVIEYFSIVRHRLEMEFGEAYKKVQPFCSPEDHHNCKNITFTGTGWLTTNVIAVLPESGDSSYNVFVKLIVHYPEHIKQYTTKLKQKSTGWTSIGEIFRFDEAPKDAAIQLQIWDDNKFKSDEHLYEEKTTLSSMINRIIFEHSAIKTNSKLFMVSIWRDNFEYSHLRDGNEEAEMDHSG